MSDDADECRRSRCLIILVRVLMPCLKIIGLNRVHSSISRCDIYLSIDLSSTRTWICSRVFISLLGPLPLLGPITCTAAD